MKKNIFSFITMIFLFQASLVQATTCDDFFSTYYIVSVDEFGNSSIAASVTVN